VPLAAKMFVAATKRQQLFLYPEKFENATDEQWREHFMAERRAGRVPGEALDFQIVCPLAEQAETGAWRESTLDDVKDYLLAQL
jgi:poly-gamma-glutamate synthesis protein (capsule biosynthesis protein)